MDDNQGVSNQEIMADAMPQIEWDDSNMNSAYANVVNAASTREEMVIFFGTNQTWNIKKSNEVNVQLSHRMVLSPYAAKRMTMLLEKVLNQYESRFGELVIPGNEQVK